MWRVVGHVTLAPCFATEMIMVTMATVCTHQAQAAQAVIIIVAHQIRPIGTKLNETVSKATFVPYRVLLKWVRAINLF